jgi:hypothetical protein
MRRQTAKSKASSARNATKAHTSRIRTHEPRSVGRIRRVRSR